MYSIDRQKFGTFVATLRKEKGITQKELAEQLFISDKAVSKWETASSVPSIDLLVPLADILGITVTELLMCRRMEQDKPLDAAQVEQVVKTAISYSEKEERAYQGKSKWGPVYIFAFFIACAEMWFVCRSGHATIGMTVEVILAAIFGIYFCFLAKTKLPHYYDENRICLYTDGLFEMNLPGLSLNNGNWTKILNVGRIWSITLMLSYPLVSYAETLLLAGIRLQITDLVLALVLMLGGFFLPIYIVAKK